MKEPANEEQVIEALTGFMLRDASGEEMCHKLGVSITKLNKLKNLVLEQFRKSKLSEKQDRIDTAQMIEDELFKLIKSKADKHLIDEMQLSYVKYCA